MFYDRLKKACKEANTSVTATLKAIGVGTANGTYWKNGSVPSSDIIVKLAEFLNTSTDYLLLGKNPFAAMSDDEKELLENYKSVDVTSKALIRERAQVLAELAAERAEQERAAAEKQKCIALSVSSVSTAEEQDDFYVDICNLPVSAGTGVYLDDNHTEPLKIKHTAIAERANYAVRVSGDSMTPEYYDGDIVLVETCPSVNIGEIGIFVVDGEGYIKQFGGDKLISLNSKYPDISLRTSESASCRGRVLGIAEPIK